MEKIYPTVTVFVDSKKKRIEGQCNIDEKFYDVSYLIFAILTS